MCSSDITYNVCASDIFLNIKFEKYYLYCIPMFDCSLYDEISNVLLKRIVKMLMRIGKLLDNCFSAVLKKMMSFLMVCDIEGISRDIEKLLV